MRFVRKYAPWVVVAFVLAFAIDLVLPGDQRGAGRLAGFLVVGLYLLWNDDDDGDGDDR